MCRNSTFWSPKRAYCEISQCLMNKDDKDHSDISVIEEGYLYRLANKWLFGLTHSCGHIYMPALRFKVTDVLNDSERWTGKASGRPPPEERLARYCQGLSYSGALAATEAELSGPGEAVRHRAPADFTARRDSLTHKECLFWSIANKKKKIIIKNPDSS